MTKLAQIVDTTFLTVQTYTRTVSRLNHLKAHWCTRPPPTQPFLPIRYIYMSSTAPRPYKEGLHLVPILARRSCRAVAWRCVAPSGGASRPQLARAAEFTHALIWKGQPLSALWHWVTDGFPTRSFPSSPVKPRVLYRRQGQPPRAALEWK